MKITILGSGKEVGRSGFLVTSNNTNVLLDYGVMLKREPSFPIHVRPKDISSVVLTHAHLDHSGNIPSLFLSGSNISVLGTNPTFELSDLLIEDMLKISGSYLPFEYADLNNMMNHSKTLQYKEKHLVNDMEITLYETGHIIGGSSILVEVEGKRIFYTGDINKRGSKLLRPADLDLPEVDILIIESTYSQTEQAPREESEKNLVQFAYDVIERGGTLFIPAFSVERAQEIACVLKATNFKHRISMDGMALKANEIMLRNPSFLRDPDGFKKIITEVEWVKGWGRRKHLVKEPGVIISPAGMLVGGTALFYLQEIAKNPNNGIALVSYQGKGTPGRLLLEKGLVSYNGKTKKSLAEVKHYEFSGHSSRTELFEILGKIKGNPRVLTVHGDDMSCTKFASEIKEKYGFDAIAPDNGQIVEVN
ncbi:MAG: MBL fold metallo-hydrolase [Nitrososphaeraceae archaeon]|nr:MBL fold metallo-hydrolase [Nitrososphaeraceae archaeon]MDW0128060.1 MBL fold metallo-hydrolase [Nitrososphaeraceae archaeon]MDW0134405.1 MBL fold metallo-hydrolase [Nitrososphaeraceae archaeon]MDW0157083.1 MBL fold metallo-hydrolase [Nitrososphaeraceae archaeon]